MGGRSINELIKSFREQAGLTQQEVSQSIGIPRASYAALEHNAEPRSGIINKLSNLYKIDPGAFFIQDENVATQYLQKKTVNRVVFNEEKLREVILYITARVGAKPNVGETVLYKLLYFSDFDYYELNRDSITGLTYIKNHYGPTPNRDFERTVEVMVNNQELDVPKSIYFTHAQKKYLPLCTPELTSLSIAEIKQIDWELVRLSDKTARELSEFSHGDIPWIKAQMGYPIEYEDVFERSAGYRVS